ncbi:MAG: alkaline phosphatase family protein [Acidiphilium sp.]|nr:alkaline phosphatase family protein [Acidiphilium sp.]MDD4935649.1 alkaline phosphatase family protein [Acidiphilium sp.]
MITRFTARIVRLTMLAALGGLCGAWSAPPAAPVAITVASAPTYAHELPTGRIVSPVGTIVATPNFPTGVVIVGNRIAVLANGATHAQSISLYDAKTLDRIDTIRAFPKQAPQSAKSGDLLVDHQDFFQGLAASGQNMLYAAGGASDDVLAIALEDHTAQVVHRYPLAWQSFPRTQYPYVYQGTHHRDVRKPSGSKPGHPAGQRYFYPSAIAVSPHYLFATGLLANSLARIDIKTGRTRYLNVGAYPNALAFVDHDRVLAVSLWGDNAVALVDPVTLKQIGTVELGPHLSATSIEAGLHPIALAARRNTPHLYIALANGDQIVEVNTATRQVMRRFLVLPYPNAASGSYPDGLALRGRRLFVANAGNDDILTIDTKTGIQLGLTPTGWYPTALTVSHDAIYAVAAKGLGSGPNLAHQWVGDMMHGLLQEIARHPTPDDRAAWTAAALGDDRFLPAQRDALAARNAKLTKMLRRKIKTVVLILRENKTFDEEFGRYPDLGHWAEPRLDLYDAQELPNLYDLAHQGALFTNFDADGEVTAQGHQWTTAASDSDFVQRTWGQYYSNRGLQGNPGWTQPLARPAKNADPDNPFSDAIDLAKLKRPATNPWISYPNGRFLFDDLARHHVDFENFGEFIARDRAGIVRPDIIANTDAGYPGWDRMLLDTTRAKVVTRWIASHRTDLPRFIYVWLPDDHTAGRNPCYYTPDYYVANNDRATGEVIAALSHTPAWRHMAVFVTEDDAQSGADHINAHRTVLVAYGPWVKPGVIETHHYSQVDMMRTIEAVLGVPPLSQWDQNARVIGGIWADHPDDAAFMPKPIKIAEAINPGTCPLIRTLRRDAGQTGHLLTPAFVAAHDKATERTPANQYTPTSLLKVPGAEQMRQEWIASKGGASYRRVMVYLARYAAQHRAPLAAFQAND